jgi:predicted phosphodiesterase
MRRRRNIEKRYGISLEAKGRKVVKRHGIIDLDIVDGMVVVFSDAHYYPDQITTAHRALLKFIEQFKPEVIVCNGDAFDGGSISRFPRIGWDNKPTIKAEIEAVKDRLGEIEGISKGKLIWTLGNHDARFETFLAANSPQFDGVMGFTLKDHFPRWEPAWGTMVNEDVMIKHRWKGGEHAVYNNTVKAGVTMVTGHLHSLKVTPYSDYNGTRYGVDTGCIAEPYGEQFGDYTEQNPVNWRSGFALLTFKDGLLLPPELIQKWDDDSVVFRGEIIPV